MKYFEIKRTILHLLQENLQNEQPQPVSGALLAEKLQLSAKEISQVIKMLNKDGVVESDQDGERVVMTRQGQVYLAEMGLSRAA
jgi:biotin operon repressor